MSTHTEQETQLSRPGRASNIFERLASSISNSVKITTIFGEPVEKDGVTVIPVARARWGFGGGSGSGGNPDTNETGEGTGGGAGVLVSPVG
ncbi:MAG TPA: spore germination protein GerW family protein, partial [Ktedonobacteraceae bacterium]|nr:spore germination protein GerW family protein [Ktedonobacteraceae bacterium]